MMMKTTPLPASRSRAAALPLAKRANAASVRPVAVHAAPQEPAAAAGASEATSSAAPAPAGPAMFSRRQLINTTVGAASSWVMAAGCPCCTSEAKASSAWNYEVNTKPIYRRMGPQGPANWPGTCAAGRQQSPVNLPLPDTKRRWSSGWSDNSLRYGDLIFNYGKARSAFVSNPGHGSPQVNFAPGNVCYINGEPYELLQYHFHTPSEHALDGQRFAMEAHLVHKSLSTGKLAVVGAMLEPFGSTNVCLQTALDLAPTPGTNVPLKDGPPNPLLLLPEADERGHRPFVHYPGSLTTPPCSEKVDWFVMTNKVDVDPSQVLRFTRFAGKNQTYGQNSRPLQPINKRTLDYLL